MFSQFYASSTFFSYSDSVHAEKKDIFLSNLSEGLGIWQWFSSSLVWNKLQRKEIEGKRRERKMSSSCQLSNRHIFQPRIFPTWDQRKQNLLK